MIGRRKVIAVAGAATLARPLAARAEPAVSGFFFANGVGIHYLVQGSAGAPVVLIHGWGLSARLNWEVPGIMAALARNHRVIALDLPGYGSSDKPATPEAYGAAWSEDIGRLLDHLAIGKAHIVGWSMGGMVTLKFAVDYPDRVLSGTLTGMGLMPQGGAMQQTWTRRPDLASRSVANVVVASGMARHRPLGRVRPDVCANKLCEY